MPLTPFQREVLGFLATQRNPESHVGGGAAINRSLDSPRYSADLDFFHDQAENVKFASEADAQILAQNGLEVKWLKRQSTHHGVQVNRGADSLRLEWTLDSAFRFFPVQPDPEFGYCLHPADLATNKCLTLAGRVEIRDFIDILFLHEHYLTLGALCWAACGKDQGFTPWSLLDFAKRNMKFREEHLAGEHLVRPILLTNLKENWLKAVAQTEDLFPQLPTAEVGCLYLDSSGKPQTPDPNVAGFSNLIRHFGSLKGAWPDLGSTS